MADDPSIGGTFRRPFAEQVAAWRIRMANQVGTAAWDDLWQAQHDRAFVVAGAQKADLLADLAAAVDKAISQGTTLEEFRRDFRRIVEERGWHGWTGEDTAKGQAWRTRVIYQTNLRTSYAAGRHAQLTAGNFAFWVYRHGGSLEPRLNHLSWDRVALPPDHPFWAQHYPPNGWGCSCYVAGARTAAGVRRVGGDPDKLLPDGWNVFDPRTGAPVGIGKGWGYAPGATVAEDIIRWARQKADRLPSGPGAALVEAAQDRIDNPRLPFMDVEPARTLRQAAERALAAGVADQIGVTKAMRLDGLNTILRAAQEVRERFELGPLRFIGHVDQHPGGRVRMSRNALACYVPGTNSVLIRANVTDAAQTAAKFTGSLNAVRTAAWRSLLGRASPEVQARGARMTEWRWAMVRDTDSLMIHEMGHRLHRAYQVQIDALLMENGVFSAGWQWLVSQYGSTNRAEFIAESFVLYLRGGPDEHDRIHPALLAFFRSIDRLAR
jgi:hypothetical protein